MDARTAAAGLATPGAPLEAGARDAIATSFGHDFAAVRVHAGPEANDAARGLGALAYTVGNDVVFAQGAYDPVSRRGRALIAHELAHVAQHGGRASAPSFLSANPSAPVPLASARLEQQAHAAADHHVHGSRLPPRWAWERPHAPFVGRIDMAWTDLPESEQYDVQYANDIRHITQEQRQPGGNPPNPSDVLRINMGEFVVPPSKGPWEADYKAIASQGGLQAVVDMSGAQPRSGLWQQRAPSDSLRRLWLQRVQWPTGAQSAVFWKDAGGDYAGSFDPHVKGEQSQIDHIVELQLGGSNVPGNLAPHDAPDNRLSGTTIAQHVQGAARSASAAVAAKGRARPRQIILFFSDATQPNPMDKYEDARTTTALPIETAARDAALAVRRGTTPRGRGTARSSLHVHFTALADAAANSRPNPTELDAAVRARGPLAPYPLSAGPSRQVLQLPARPAEPHDEDLIENSAIPENDAARELISGMTLEKVKRPPSGSHIVTGWIDSEEHRVRSGTRLPISVPNVREKEMHFVVNEPGTNGRLTLPGGASQVHFLYPYLSRGQLSFSMTDNGLAGHGEITPSVPLLSRVPITVDFDRTGLRGSVQADPRRLSLPPFRVTEAALVVTLAPELQAGGRVAFVLGSIVTGTMEAGVDPQGLFARGNVVAHVPGLDEATGQIEYRPATGVAGSVVARATRPTGLVSSGEVRVDFTSNSWRVGGQIGLRLPGNSDATLSVRREGERVLYGGRAHLIVPGLHPVDVDVLYDGEHVTGSAHTTFTLLGATGDVTLRYRDGRFDGDGSIQLQRGRFNGRLDAHLDHEGRISGRGTGTLTIRPGLVGTVGVEYGTDHRLRVTGELRFPPYRFLEPRGARYQLFQHNLPDIPIFAIPLGIGSVGLVARIGGGLAARYQFGPGEIRDMVIRAALNPLEEDMNAEVSAEARLVLPAEAGLELSIRAGIGASVVFASATGGITLTGGVLLRGGLDAAARLAYARGILTFDTQARISVQPVLTLRIEADILIEAAVGGPWRFPYELASYSYATGLEFGMIAPFHYQSDQPLRLPSVSDIQWIVPNIDVGALANRVAGQVRAGIGF